MCVTLASSCAPRPPAWVCSATSAAPCTRHMPASVWFERSICFCAILLSQVRRRSGLCWYPRAMRCMRSSNISGSSWNSFIFTVSDRIMCRLNTRSFTCSGNVVSARSESCSAYTSMVFSARRSDSSLKVVDVPTSEDRDIVTCIFTRLKLFPSW